MKQWFVLFNKEWLEILRSYRIIWLPIGFIVLGASQPIATFFMPDILASAGNMPEGAVIRIPTPQPFEVMAGALSQFGVIGLLLVALSGMGAISGEKASGTAAMVLVKPVSHVSFVTAKWAALLLLAVLSFAAGYGAAWYYTASLFDSVGWGEVVQSALLFALWLGFVGTLALLFSSLLRSAAAATFGALATAAVLSIASSSLPFEQSWNPGRLSGLAAESLNAGAASPGDGQGAVWLTVIVTATAMLAALAASARSLKRMPSND
ncbi:ABC transporter permease [Cohnella thailandensis]|uniref:ABC transporter permease subunit n=1 Tax=Cohnella thailandensis TaxID=557557 RepID=A0A841SSM2_9BACL|nr:ABC transporter permease subunit [Cohnella thailandensis]MBB6633055.1 ABC transporter permease subunit [Cohnella thailandensis]MBP1975250.1 ABC-2 type transport system permease protein [Cohnella thailandensis]